MSGTIEYALFWKVPGECIEHVDEDFIHFIRGEIVQADHVVADGHALRG